MGALIYLSGVVVVFTTLWLWNRALERNTEIPTWDKEENKVNLSTAVLTSLMSWGSVAVLIVLSFFGLIIYGLSESSVAKKVNLWFKQERV